MQKIISTLIIVAVIAGGLYLLSNFFQKDEIEGVDFNETEVQNQEENNSNNSMDNNQSGIRKVTKLATEIIKEGEGEEAKNGDKVTVHYTGVLEDGTKFDSSLDRGQPFAFNLGAGQVIRGWELGVVGMKIGEVRMLYIPSEFGYGEAGTPGGPIPPNANLIFQVELLGIE